MTSDWRHWGFSSYEAWIESKAGASKPCTPGDCHCGGDKTGALIDAWPQPKPPPFPADDEDDETPGG